MRRTKKTITYHGRTGRPVVHATPRGRKFIMVRAKGGGVKRLYEGARYRIGEQRTKLKKILRLG